MQHHSTDLIHSEKQLSEISDGWMLCCHFGKTIWSTYEMWKQKNAESQVFIQ